MTHHRCPAALLVAFALFAVSTASAGGPADRIVGVGANGAWHAIDLKPSGQHSEAVLRGTAVPVPHNGYIRVYTSVSGLPGIPGRYYPSAHILCLYWQEPASNCLRLGSAGTGVLAALAHLPLRHLAPTVPVAVRYRTSRLRYANGNIFAALELALERPALRRATAPRDAIPLTVLWRGPSASRMPAALSLAPTGVYTQHRLFPLGRGPWCYLSDNLPHASASQIEATSRVCR